MQQDTYICGGTIDLMNMLKTTNKGVHTVDQLESIFSGIIDTLRGFESDGIETTIFSSAPTKGLDYAVYQTTTTADRAKSLNILLDHHGFTREDIKNLLGPSV